MRVGTQTEKEFLQEIRSLMERYGVMVVCNEHYDQNEDPCGTSYTFVGDGIHIDVSELEI